MSNNTNTLYFDHEGDFEISVENDVLFVDINLIQKIVFTDHTNRLQYTFSKFKTKIIDDDLIQINKTGLQSN